MFVSVKARQGCRGRYAGRELSHRDMERAFELFDADRNGKVDVYEVFAVMAAHACARSVEILERERERETCEGAGCQACCRDD